MGSLIQNIEEFDSEPAQQERDLLGMVKGDQRQMMGLERNLDIEDPELNNTISNIDNNFIDDLEGFENKLYVPKKDGKPLDNSGATIGSGLDLGQTSVEELKQLTASPDFIDKAKPFIGKKGLAAEEAIKNNPTDFNVEEVKRLGHAKRNLLIQDYIKYYNKKTGKNFEDLDPKVKTAITSVITQYGSNLEKRTPKFNKAIIENDIPAMKKELENFGDKYPTRRKKEAGLLEGLSFLNPFSVKEAQASEQAPLFNSPEPSLSQEILNSPLGEFGIQLQQGFEKVITSAINDKAMKVISGGMSLEEAEDLRDMTLSELKEMPTEISKASQYIVKTISNQVQKNTQELEKFLKNPISSINKLASSIHPEQQELLTPEEREGRNALLKIANKSLKPLSRIMAPVQGGLGSAIEGDMVEDISASVVKSFLKPEDTESLISKIPFQKWELEGDGIAESVMRLTPRAIAEALETFAIAELTLNLPSRLIKEGKWIGAENDRVQLFNKIRNSKEGRDTVKEWVANRGAFDKDKIGGDVESLIDDVINFIEIKSARDPRFMQSLVEKQTIGKALGALADDLFGGISSFRVKIASEAGTLKFASEKQHLKSNLKAVALSKIPNNATPNQILNTLKNAGISAEELEFSGLQNFIEGKEKISKEELINYIEENKVQIEEKILGGVDSAEEWERQSQELAIEMAAEDGNDFFDLDPEEQEELLFNAREELNDEAILETKVGTKYKQYTLPGGENYREVLLKLPSINSKTKQIKATQLKIGDKFIYNGDLATIASINPEWHGKIEGTTYVTTQEGGEIELKNNEILNLGEFEGSFTSSHWDDPNVLTHLRLNDRIDSEGKKVLFIEEIQSDWHAKGKKEGYENIEGRKAQQEWSKVENELWDKSRRLRELEGAYNRNQYKDEIAELIPEVERLKKLDKELMEKANSFKMGNVPDAPFKQKWHELGLKKAIEIAVREGYDKVAFISGQQTADRYDLSKHIDEIDYFKNLESGDVTVKAYSLAQATPIVKTFELSDHSGLEGFIGKDVAKKIIDGGNEGSLKNADLKVGGEWAYKFYDEILPKSAEKYIKQWGGKVEDISLPNIDKTSEEVIKFSGGLNPSEYKQMKQKGFTITPQMRKEVAEIGQPMFGKRLAGSFFDKLKSEKGFSDFSKDIPENMPEANLEFPQLLKFIKEKDIANKTFTDEEIAAMSDSERQEILNIKLRNAQSKKHKKNIINKYKNYQKNIANKKEHKETKQIEKKIAEKDKTKTVDENKELASDSLTSTRRFKQTDQYKEFAKYAEENFQGKDIHPSILIRHASLTADRVAEFFDGGLDGVMYNAIVKPVLKSAEIMQKEAADTSQKIKEFNVIEGSSEDVGASLFAQQKAVEVNQKSKALAQYVRDKYDEYLDRLNEVRFRLGVESIPKRQNYITHLNELNVLSELFGGLERVTVKSRISQLKSEILDAHPDWSETRAFEAAKRQVEGLTGVAQYVDARQPAFKFAKKRLDDYESDPSIIRSFSAYMNNALRYIHQGENVAKNKAYKDVLPANAKEFIRLWNTEQVAGRQAPSSIKSPTVKRFILDVRGALGANIILGNAGTLAMQLVSFPQVVAFAGVRNFLYGMQSHVTSYITGKETKFQNSRTKAMRHLSTDIGLGDSLIDEILKNIGKKGFRDPASSTRHVIQIGRDILRATMETADQFMVGISFESFYRKATLDGLSPDQAMEYAEIMTGKTQANYSKELIPPYLNTFDGKIAAQFGAFAMNQWEMFKNDFGKDLKFDDQSERNLRTLFKHFIKYMIAAYIADQIGESVFGRQPYEVKNLVDETVGVISGEEPPIAMLEATAGTVTSYMPFLSSVKYGSMPPVLEFGKDAIYAMVGQGQDQERSIFNLANKWSYNILLPYGGNQLRKSLEGAEASTEVDFPFVRDVSEDKFLIFENLEIGKAILFGAYSTQPAREYFEKNEKRKQLRKAYGIKGSINGDLNMNILKSMPEKQREVLINSYSLKTQNFLRSELGQTKSKLTQNLE